MAKSKYYHIDTGFFPQIIKLCFNDVAFQQLLSDKNISVDLKAFDYGAAETHAIHTPNGSLIILIIDVENHKDEADLVGTIAHEASHAVEHLAKFIGEEDLSGETRAYLTQSIVEQVYLSSEIEREEHARKRDRSLSNKKGQAQGGDVFEVDIIGKWSSGPDSDTAEEVGIRRTKNTKGRNIAKTKDSVSTAK